MNTDNKKTLERLSEEHGTDPVMALIGRMVLDAEYYGEMYLPDRKLAAWLAEAERELEQ